MNDYKVSIIIPVFNAEKYISECINSILKQTYNNIEIIIVNDGSTDNSQKIIEEFQKKDERIKLINNKNQGVSETRNCGIENATGDYICFSDADDYLMEDYIEYLLKLVVKNNADIGLTEKMFTTFRKKENEKEKIVEFSNVEALKEILMYKIPIGVYCKIFKKSFLDSNEIRFNKNFYIGEGFNFNTYAFQRANKVIVGQKKIYFYRRNNPHSATTNYAIDKWKNAIEAIVNIKNDLVFKDNDVLYTWKYAYWHTVCDAFNFMVIAKRENDNIEYYREYKEIIKKYAKYSFGLPISFKEKIRSFLYIINPKIVPFLIEIRNRKYFNDSQR